MGAVCCRCHNSSGLDDALVQLPAPLSVSMSASERLVPSANGAVRPVVARALSMSSASSPPAGRDERFHVPLSQSLANYVSFPFPFVKKPRPTKKKSGRFHGLWVSKRHANGSDAVSGRSTRGQALASVPYVGEYWRRSASGALVPLSLVELCIRSVCGRLADRHDREVAEQLWLPTELAAHALAWLKRHSLLERRSFQALARSLLHEWDLSGQHDAEDDWFDDLPWEPLQQLSCLDLSGCAHLSQLGSDQWQMVPQLPNLVKVSFRGCTKLRPSAVEMLQFSPKLTSVALAGCVQVDDECLASLGGLARLKALDLAGCRLVTDNGLRSLRSLGKLETLRLSRCPALTDEALANFGSSHPLLKELDIAHCRIGLRGMRHIGQIRTLEVLVVRGCSRLVDGGMAALATLSNLTYFDARHCEALHTIPTEWEKLEVLLLGFSSFAEPDAAVLQKLPNLVELDVRKCRVLKRGFEFISHLTKLERLGLAETGLTDPGLLSICKRLGKLRALNISSTEISDAGSEGLARLKELRVLHMDTTGVTNRALAHLSFLPHLERLDLFGAGITDSGIAHLVPLLGLKELDLCSGSITDRGVEILSKITSLTSLNLGQNRNIRAKSLFHIRTLTNLRSLNLSNTGITAMSLRHLYPLKDLQSLTVYGCALTQNHIEVLRDILPELRTLRCA